MSSIFTQGRPLTFDSDSMIRVVGESWECSLKIWASGSKWAKTFWLRQELKKHQSQDDSWTSKCTQRAREKSDFVILSELKILPYFDNSLIFSVGIWAWDSMTLSIIYSWLCVSGSSIYSRCGNLRQPSAVSHPDQGARLWLADVGQCRPLIGPCDRPLPPLCQVSARSELTTQIQSSEAPKILNKDS